MNQKHAVSTLKELLEKRKTAAPEEHRFIDGQIAQTMEDLACYVVAEAKGHMTKSENDAIHRLQSPIRRDLALNGKISELAESALAALAAPASTT